MSANRYLQDERMNIALGRNPKAKSVHKFGARTGISTSPISIWDDGLVTYPWSTFDTAKVVAVVGASDPNRQVTVSGLDANFDEVSEVITTGSTGTVQFKRVFRAFMTGDGSNIGAIEIRATNSTGTIVAQINPGYSQTLMCVYTIPRNRTGLLLKGVASASADKDMIIEFYGRFLDENGNYGPFRIQHIANLYQGNYVYEFAVPLALPAMSDLDIRVRGYSNDSGAKVSAAFDMILHEINTDY